MIKKLKYKEVDFSRYSKCLDQSLQKNQYAKKEVLDVLCESWELLVYGDYEFVMPIPIKKKLGFRIVIMPLFCQQLGVFGLKSNDEIELQFLNFLQKNFKVFSYFFNDKNLLAQNLKKKKNYFIEKTDYQLLRKNYFKGRKSTVKTAQYLNFKELRAADFLDFIKNNFKGLDKKGDMDQFFTYMNFLESENKLRLFGSYKENDLTNMAIIIDDENQFSLLGLINDDQYKSDNGASFLIDRILKENIHEKSFNFMGGSIRGIEVFFKSFGSVLQEYPVLENSKKDLLKNFYKK
ncbi:hypothetical protein [Kaistella jeonii]|uniref:hypothetical protein n=1 Tax=Kaistella jeonii TaxID=266749 RepID=UPI00068A196E|nr:hypothetical protein [Kaistella jeonii]SFC07964.1 hypothetical protein SAMN05421876_10620 [Kaistella jeonii]VEI95148.1 Uncharacterised protein [Kaistella jeonii]